MANNYINDNELKKFIKTQVDLALKNSLGNKKTSDYAALPGGLITDTWLFDIANPTALNYKGTALEVKDYVNAGKAGGKTIDGGTLTTQTLTLRNNAIDDFGVDILADGIVRSNVTNYETLVLNDDDLTNKKYVDDEAAKVVAEQEILTVASPAQTAFTLAKTPSGVASFGIFLNGVKQPTTAYSFAGTAFTWGGSPVLQVTDLFEAWYDWQAPSPGLSLGTHSGTLPAAGAILVITAASLGLADARQIVMSQLMGRATDQNWYFAGNTWGGATHDFNYTIPTLADPNVGDLVIQVAGTASSVASQPFELIYYYQGTNFLS